MRLAWAPGCSRVWRSTGAAAVTFPIEPRLDGEDWRAYNRLSLWIKPEVRGFPMLPLAIVLRNDGVEKVPDRYGREGTHYVTLENNKWTQVVWEIEPLARDRGTAIEIGYWVNKMLA